MTDQQREQIIGIASHMFVTEGIKSVRMDDIAHQAGISKRTLYETFGDKDELIFVAIKHYFKILERENTEIGERAPNVIVAMLEVTRHMIQNSETNWKLFNALRRFHPTIHKRLQEDDSSKDRYEQTRTALEYGVKLGEIDERTNLTLAVNMLYLIGASVIFDTNDIPLPLPEGATPQRALFEMTTYILRGIATPKGVDIIERYWSVEMNKNVL